MCIFIPPPLPPSPSLYNQYPPSPLEQHGYITYPYGVISRKPIYIVYTICCIHNQDIIAHVLYKSSFMEIFPLGSYNQVAIEIWILQGAIHLMDLEIRSNIQGDISCMELKTGHNLQR